MQNDECRAMNFGLAGPLLRHSDFCILQSAFPQPCAGRMVVPRKRNSATKRHRSRRKSMDYVSCPYHLRGQGCPKKHSLFATSVLRGINMPEYRLLAGSSPRASARSGRSRTHGAAEAATAADAHADVVPASSIAGAASAGALWSVAMVAAQTPAPEAVVYVIVLVLHPTLPVPLHSGKSTGRCNKQAYLLLCVC